MLGEAAVAASATRFKAQLAGLWAPGVSGCEGTGGRQDARSPALHCHSLCISAVLSPLASVFRSANRAEASSSLSFPSSALLRPWADAGGNSGSSLLSCFSLNFPDYKTLSPSSISVFEE